MFPPRSFFDIRPDSRPGRSVYFARWLRSGHIAALFITGLVAGFGCDDSWNPDPEPPPPPPPVIDSPEKVVDALARAYRTRDLELFASLLSQDPGAEYLFVLGPPRETGVTQWGRTEEMRSHIAMFRPESVSLPPELWLQSLTITLTPATTFAERKDLYGSGGLDSLRWRAVEARYSTHVFFDLVGTDYLVENEANFFVIEDRTKHSGDVGQFCLYIWEDLCGSPSTAMPAAPRQARPFDTTTLRSSAIEPACWSQIKAMFLGH